jgi:hypothetical protein
MFAFVTGIAGLAIGYLAGKKVEDLRWERGHDPRQQELPAAPPQDAMVPPIGTTVSYQARPKVGEPLMVTVASALGTLSPTPMRVVWAESSGQAAVVEWLPLGQGAIASLYPAGTIVWARRA